MKDKTVLVTGSSIGLGASIARIFAKNGYNVAINYLTHKKEAEDLKIELEEKYNIKCFCIKCDISHDSSVTYMYETLKKEFNHIDVVVNNAGICIDNEFDKNTKEDFDKIFEVNAYGEYLVSRVFGKDMYDRKNGSIINISSNNAIDSYYEESIFYDASKAAVINMTHNIASHYSPYVRVNCICPGWINTPMNKNMNPSLKEKELNKILLHRFAEPDEIANLVYFLSTDEASYINDSIIKIDGGKKC